MTEQEQKAHAQMIARKAVAFDWLTTLHAHRRMTDGWFVLGYGDKREGSWGPTPLEAVEAAMKGTE